MTKENGERFPVLCQRDRESAAGTCLKLLDNFEINFMNKKTLLLGYVTALVMDLWTSLALDDLRIRFADGLCRYKTGFRVLDQGN